MRQRTLNLIVVLFILNPSNFIIAQKLGPAAPMAISSRIKGEIIPKAGISRLFVEKMGNKFRAITFFEAPQPSFSSGFSIREDHSKGFQLPVNYYAQCLGIICRQELKMDLHSPVLMRFRLGSLNYVNYLDSKPNAIRP